MLLVIWLHLWRDMAQHKARTLLAVLSIAVGVFALGLTGALAINMFERRREIGIMRAIGTTASGIIQAFVGEGMIVGVPSWRSPFRSATR